MDGQEIDKLLLEIQVKDKTKGGSEAKIDNLANAVSNLQKALGNVDTSGINNIVRESASMSKAGDNLAEFTGEIKKQSIALNELNEATVEMEARKMRDNLSETIGSAENNAQNLGKTFDEINTKSEFLQAKLGIVQGKLEDSELTEERYVNLKGQEISLTERIAREQDKIAKAQERAAAQLAKEQERLAKETERLAQEQEKIAQQAAKEQEKIVKEIEASEKAQTEVNKKTSKFSQILQSVKRVALYRFIRAAIKVITNAFKEGFTNLANFSSQVNNQVSKISSSFTILKNSVAVIFLPLLNAITPVIQYVAQGVAGLANVISYLTANLQGSATYLKVNVEYFKKLNEQANLLSFDTFEKLGQTTDYSDMFEEVSTATGLGKASEDLNEISIILAGILATVTAIGISKLIMWLSSGGITKIGTDIDSLIGKVSPFLYLIIGTITAVTNIIDLTKNWNILNDMQKAYKIVAAIFGIASALAAVAAVIASIVSPATSAARIATAIAAGLGVVSVLASIGGQISGAKAFENGGGFSSADLFYANENGNVELIASSNNGGGGAVMNMAQLEQAIYSGMIRAMSTGSNGESAIYLDGNKVGTFVAANTGFRNEANRRNTNLNWR